MKNKSRADCFTLTPRLAELDIPDLLEVVELGLEALAEGRGARSARSLDVVEGAEDAQAVALVLLEVSDGALDLVAPLNV